MCAMDSAFGFCGGKATLKGWWVGIDKSLITRIHNKKEQIVTPSCGMIPNDKSFVFRPIQKAAPVERLL